MGILLSKIRFNFNAIQTLKSRLRGDLCHIRFGDLWFHIIILSWKSSKVLLQLLSSDVTKLKNCFSAVIVIPSDISCETAIVCHLFLLKCRHKLQYGGYLRQHAQRLVIGSDKENGLGRDE